MFPWAGQAVLRSGYEAGASWLWFDVGPFGSNPVRKGFCLRHFVLKKDHFTKTGSGQT
jgi:hypothetical protein